MDFGLWMDFEWKTKKSEEIVYLFEGFLRFFSIFFFISSKKSVLRADMGMNLPKKSTKSFYLKVSYTKITLRVFSRTITTSANVSLFCFASQRVQNNPHIWHWAPQTMFMHHLPRIVFLEEEDNCSQSSYQSSRQHPPS